jgi:hypothetical protein
MPQPIAASVVMHHGRPTLLINGNPYAPLIYALSDCPGARWSWEEVPSRNIGLFAAQGVRLFQLDVWFEQMLGEDNRLDITLARKLIAGVLAQCPEAAVMLRLHVNAPAWWCARHPDECVGYADVAAYEPPAWGQRRPVGTDGDQPVRASFASRLWHDWATARLRDFCTQLAATPEGNALFAVQLANGLYGEWHQFGFLHHDPDTGVAATHSYRAWLRNRYATDDRLAAAWHRPGATIDAVQPPDSPARERADCGPLRDPQKQQDVIDYFTWLHTTMADALLDLAATVKKSWPRPIVTAAFQGYFYGQFGRNAAGSHLAMDRVLASPHLDCLCSPQSYTAAVRAMGGSGHGRGILGSVRRAGKLWLDENDHGTFLVGCPWDKDFKTTQADDIACLRRNTLQSVLRGGGQWWYDFGMVAGTPAFASHGNVGWWDDPRLSQEIAAIHRVAQARHAHPFVRPADTLVVHDPWSFCHTVAQRWSLEGFKFGDQPPVGPNPFSARGMDGLLEGLFRSGLVFDEAIIGELATMDLSPFRLIIFGTTPVLDEAQRQLITTKLATGGRHVVLTGFTGWGNGRTVGAELATAFSGITTTGGDTANPTSTLKLGDATETQILEAPKFVPAYDVPEAQVVGRWADGRISAARRQADDATWWSFAVAPIAPSVLRLLGRCAGCHVLNNQDDATTLGDGLLMVHTLEGGPRELRLPGGPTLAVTLPARSTTVFDATTGAVLLGN